MRRVGDRQHASGDFPSHRRLVGGANPTLFGECYESAMDSTLVLLEKLGERSDTDRLVTRQSLQQRQHPGGTLAGFHGHTLTLRCTLGYRIILRDICLTK